MDVRLDLDFAQKLITEIEGEENQTRKRNCYKSYQIREGLLYLYVKARLKEMFPKTWEQYTTADYSILKKIIEKKAKAYRDTPVRKLDGPEKDTEEYQKLLKDSNFNSQMKEFDMIFNEHKYGAMAIFPNEPVIEGLEKKNTFKFIPLAPYEYDVVKDKDGKSICFALSYPSLDITRGASDGYNQVIGESGNSDEGDKRIYVMWTEKEHKVFSVTGKGKDSKVNQEVIEGNLDGVNPYGVLPIVDLPKKYDRNYPLPNPLPNQTVELNALFSIYLQSGSMQVGQLILKYPSDQAMETVHQGIFTGMKLPQSKNPDDSPTSAEYISPAPDLAGHKDSILTFASMILDEQGINSNSVINPNEKFTSGLDRLLNSADVQSIIEENQNKYVDIENEIFAIVKKIQENNGGYRYSSNSLNIRYLKPKMLISDSENLENLKKKKELGIFEDWELLQDYNPNLSEQEAKDKIAKSRVEKSAMLKAMVGNAKPMDPNANQ